MTTRPRGTDAHIRFTEDERQAIDIIAKRECRSFQGQVRHVMQQWLKEQTYVDDTLSRGEHITRATRKHVQ